MRHALAISLALLLSAAPALADSKTDTLVKSLREDSSFKVRAKAAEILAKGGDVSAVPALVKSLKDDSNEVVRAAAAAALGALASAANDQEALKALKEAASKDPSALVKGEAQKASERFPTATPVPLSAGGYLIGDVYVELGKFSDNTKLDDPAMATRFQKFLDGELAAAGKKASAPPKGKKPLTLAGTILKAESKVTGKTTSVSVNLSITVTREASIVAVVSKSGSIEYDGKISSSEEASARADVIEALTVGAYEEINKNLPKWWK